MKGATPEELARFEVEFKQLKKLESMAEERWAFTNSWAPAAWFASDAWCRMVVDAYTMTKTSMRIIDYKTGKVREGYDEQLSLYALGGLIQKKVQHVTVELWYLDQGVVLPNPPTKFTQSDVPGLKKIWAKRAKPLLADTTFAPRPGAYCRWCNFSAVKGGPCVY